MRLQFFRSDLIWVRTIFPAAPASPSSRRLEALIDRYEEGVPPLSTFIIPGGSLILALAGLFTAVMLVTKLVLIVLPFALVALGIFLTLRTLHRRFSR